MSLLAKFKRFFVQIVKNDEKWITTVLDQENRTLKLFKH
jgi:hypothetical protein